MKLHIVKAGSIKVGDTVIFRNRYLKGSPFEVDNQVKIAKTERFVSKVTGKSNTVFYTNYEKLEPYIVLHSETQILRVS